MRISDWSSDVCSSDLKRRCPDQILLFIKARLDLDHGRDRLARLRRIDQRTNDGRLLASAVERLLDRHHVRVRRRLPQEGEDDVEALVRMVDDNVLGFDRGKAIAVMFPDSFGKKIGRASCRERGWQYV